MPDGEAADESVPGGVGAPKVPTTDAGIKEADRMRRAKGISQQIWGATRGLLALLGASAPFTYGLANATTPDIAPLWTLVSAVLVVVLGALAYFLTQFMTASRSKDPDKTAAKPRRGAYKIINAFLVVQILALPVAAGLQGWAVYQTLQGKNATNALNAELADRIGLYARNQEALYLVRGYCDEHVVDDPASNKFLNACTQFKQKPPPSSKEAKRIAAGLS